MKSEKETHSLENLPVSIENLKKENIISNNFFNEKEKLFPQ